MAAIESSGSAAKKSKGMTTAATMVGIQGSLSYLETIIQSASVSTADASQAKCLQSAFKMLTTKDVELPQEDKAWFLDVLWMDKRVVDAYLMNTDKELHHLWINQCLNSFDHKK